MRGRAWTTGELAALRRCAASGMMAREIADAIGRTRNAVSVQLYKLGLRTSSKFSTLVLTDEQADEIISLRKRGWSWRRIERKIGRNGATIKAALARYEEAL